MSFDKWKYYNHAAIPKTAPHENVDISILKDKKIWKNDKRLYLARWTSDFDCGYETNWWYVIKDEPFDISSLKSKRRYEIKKGLKNFDVKEINPLEWTNELYHITCEAYLTYPESYRPNITYESFYEEIKNWNFYKVYGAFSIDDNNLCGYSCLIKSDQYIDFCMMKAIPDKEKFGLNAAMVNMVLVDNEDVLKSGGYICDGARSIHHETAFQDYLEKYFGFRKAYCKLHIIYRPRIKMIILLLYPFRKILKKLQKPNVIQKINSLLVMEEISRS